MTVYNQVNNIQLISEVVTKIIMSIIITNSKIHKPLTYKEAISDLFHTCQWRKIVEKELQNLKNHHT